MARTHIAYFDEYTKDLDRLTFMLERQMSRGPVSADKEQVERLIEQMNKLGAVLSKIPLYK